MKPLEDKKSASYEIYRRKCNVHTQPYSNKKNAYEWAKHVFATVSLSQMRVHKVETH